MAGELALAAFQYLGQRAISGTFASAEISFYASYAPRPIVVLAGLALLIIAEIFREGIKMRTDLETAREIQTSLVAAEALRRGPVSIHARMRPAAEVGGDYYDVIDLDGGRVAFVVADVAGKGLLLYTDGITEAEDRTGEQFGVERLETAIAGVGQSAPAGVLDAIIAAVVRFRGTARQSDDMTMMLVSREVAT